MDPSRRACPTPPERRTRARHHQTRASMRSSLKGWLRKTTGETTIGLRPARTTPPSGSAAAGSSRPPRMNRLPSLGDTTKPPSQASRFVTLTNSQPPHSAAAVIGKAFPRSIVQDLSGQVSNQFVGASCMRQDGAKHLAVLGSVGFEVLCRHCFHEEPEPRQSLNDRSGSRKIVHRGEHKH